MESVKNSQVSEELQGMEAGQPQIENREISAATARRLAELCVEMNEICVGLLRPEKAQDIEDPGGADEKSPGAEIARYLDGYLSREPVCEKVAIYVLTDLASKNPALAKMIRESLWDDVQPFIEEIGWEKELKEDIEIIQDIHSVIHFWRLYKDHLDADGAELAAVPVGAE